MNYIAVHTWRCIGECSFAAVCFAFLSFIQLLINVCVNRVEKETEKGISM